jgi:spore maturation protein CgeB
MAHVKTGTKILLVDYPYPDGQAREQALRSMGMDIMVFNHIKSRIWSGNHPAKKRLQPVLRLIRPLKALLSRIDSDRTNNELITTADVFNPDVVLIVKGDNLSQSSIRNLRKNGRLLLNWDGDSILSPGRTHAVLPKLDMYDFYFTIDTVDLLPPDIRAAMQAKNPNIYTVPFAANTDFFKPTTIAGPEGNALASVLAFIGTVNPVRKTLLEKLVDLDLKIWGPADSAWGPWCARGSVLEKAYQHRSVYGDELVRIYSTAAIVLDMHFLFAVAETVPNVTMRVFEVPAAGGFVLTNRSPQLSLLFDVDNEIICYSSAHELREKAVYYLKNPHCRREIAEKARRRVLAEHTFKHRLETIFKIIDGKFP